MCGIVGYISTGDEAFVQEKNHFMHFALTLDTLRGYDSTGMIRVGGDFEVDTVHTTMAGDQWVHTEDYKGKMRKAWAAVGHNRAATAGSVKLENAHPFTFGPVSMVHNGTLYKEGASLPTFDKNLEVDSMQIAKALSSVTPDRAHEILESIDGSFCLVWSDERDQTVNMCRNSDRPMHFGFNASKTLMFFMSDGTQLSSILKSLNRSPAAVQSIYSLDRMKICKWRKGDMAPQVKTFKAYVRPVPTPVVRYNRPSNDAGFKKVINKWRDSIVKKPSLRDIYVEVNKEKRTIPARHILELRKEYDLSPTDTMEFIPVISYPQQNGRCTVVGTVIHAEWGHSEWDAVIHDVPRVSVNAYWLSTWNVRPVGISRPFSGGSVTCPSILATVEGYEWDRHTCDTPEEQEGESDENVQIGHRLISKHRLGKMLDKGCVQCGGNVSLEDAKTSATIVNDGNDLLCHQCLIDLQGEIPQ